MAPACTNNPATDKQIFCPVPATLLSTHDEWEDNVKKAKLDTVHRRARLQEKNRQAAIRSRQRKKAEWDRLVNAEVALLEENLHLKSRIAELEKRLLGK